MRFTAGYLLKYSALERCDHVEQSRRPIFREVLARHNGQGSIDLAGFADAPTGAALGSFGSLTVGLL
jgi:galactokinase/mevalonate kinase-like predicted kinase